MKRDDDLIRTLLLNIESRHQGGSLWGTDVSPIGANEAAVGEHLRLLIDAGFIRGESHSGIDTLYLVPGNFQIDGLKWEGHEFLNTIRSDEVWKRTKEKIKSVGGSVSTTIMAQVAAAISKSMLGLT
ncbi:DUF2513 domain-containing protein [Xanthomonas phaseoli]|uniref:DUF2513 domain-containing protein n=1 Tax=Xanthomonas phaseoli TaxID=1985254 RepID=UPI0009B66771|nr:DUF2513 domain-containing protein [Xanthomonas phaseoli]MBO9718611.1 DUF2513 domain-containing protein [Xanthomonas phaseoli pv. manihotis]